MANFSHRRVYSDSLHYPMSIMAIDPVCSQTILPIWVTLFPSGMICVTNILSINGNNTLFCSVLKGKHAGARFGRYSSYFFRFANANLIKMSILRKFDL